MKAKCFHEHGDLDALQYSGVPEPPPRSGEALVQIKACALNPWDVWVRRDWSGLRKTVRHRAYAKERDRG